jgi:hypothetical protein
MVVVVVMTMTTVKMMTTIIGNILWLHTVKETQTQDLSKRKSRILQAKV